MSERAESTPGQNGRVLQGIVVSNKMQKSVVVEVSTQKKHPNYGKYVSVTNRYMSHDEANACAVGDRVEIIECRPLSRHKRWRIANILEKAK